MNINKENQEKPIQQHSKLSDDCYENLLKVKYLLTYRAGILPKHNDINNNGMQ